MTTVAVVMVPWQWGWQQCTVGGKPMWRDQVRKEGERRSEATFLKMRMHGVDGLKGD
jgi:hypothetical protein